MACMKRLSVLLIGVVLASGCVRERTMVSEPETLRMELEGSLDDAARDGFSGAVLIEVEGETVIARGYGMADRDAETPNDVSTAFDFGSVMKDVTAAAIYALQDRGELSVEDTLADLLPDVPEDKAGITVLQLLQHSAGLGEYHDTEGDFEAMTRLEARARIFDQELLFAPGDDEAYSNSGFTLLADIVEERSGQPFTAYVRQELLEPAGMSSTGFFGEPLWDEVETAIGYDAETFQDNDPASWPYTWALVGNGGLVSTVEDVQRWLVATREGQVLSADAFAAYDEEYLSLGSGELEGFVVYSYAGAGDFGLGGGALDCPEASTRIIFATNAYDTFDSEALAVELFTRVLEEL